MDRACRSPTRLTDASASSRAVFNKSALKLLDCNASNGGHFRAFSTVGKSQGGTVRGLGGFILLAPRKNNHRTPHKISAHRSASNRGMESRYGCRVNFDGVDEEHCLSHISCRNERTTDTSEVTRSKSRMPSRENGPFQSAEASSRRGSSFCHRV